MQYNIIVFFLVLVCSIKKIPSKFISSTNARKDLRTFFYFTQWVCCLLSQNCTWRRFSRRKQYRKEIFASLTSDNFFFLFYFFTFSERIRSANQETPGLIHLRINSFNIDFDNWSQSGVVLVIVKCVQFFHHSIGSRCWELQFQGLLATGGTLSLFRFWNCFMIHIWWKNQCNSYIRGFILCSMFRVVGWNCSQKLFFTYK